MALSMFDESPTELSIALITSKDVSKPPGGWKPRSLMLPSQSRVLQNNLELTSRYHQLVKESGW